MSGFKKQVAQNARQHSRPAKPIAVAQETVVMNPVTATKSSRTNGKSQNIASEAIVHRLSDVEPEQLEWLWPNRIPLGKLTLLAGDPGLGKSFVTMDMAARVSRGAVWPDDSTKRQTIGSVVIFNCEDGLADTIRPRLDRANADVSRIVAVEGVKVFDAETGESRQRGFTLAHDLPRLENVVCDLADCRLIVIDPISGFLGDTDSHKNADVRALLSPLKELAEKNHTAVLMVTHLAKGTGGKSIYRSMGSLAFTAAARAAWHVTKDPDDPIRRLILPAKMNLAPDPTGLAYRIEDGGIHWEADPVLMTADDVLAREANQRTDGHGGEREEAEAWLREYLADGARESKVLQADAREHGISNATLRRALKIVCGKPHKTSMDGPWMRSLLERDDGFD